MLMLMLLPAVMACGEEERRGDEPGSVADRRERVEPPLPESSSVGPATAVPMGDAASLRTPTSTISVGLAPDGFTLVFPDGRTRHLPFGSDARQVTAAVGDVLGPPRMSEVPECRLVAAAWTNGLHAYFSDGTFEGWYVGGTGGGRSPATLSGISLGASLRELTDSHAARRVEGSTLGVEYVAGDMAVILSGEEADARITDLWAGLTCVAR